MHTDTPNTPPQLSPPPLDPYAVPIAHTTAMMVPPRQQTNALAVISIVFGALAIFLLGILTGIPGIICGHAGLHKAKQNPLYRDSKTTAIVGLALSYLGTLFGILYLSVIAYVIWIISTEGIF